jgi:hypothetical protein
MNYSFKVPHPLRPSRPKSCIVTWLSLEAYLTDCEQAYKTLPYEIKHKAPNTKRMREPDPSILSQIQAFQTKFDHSKFINSRKRVYDVAGGTLDIPMMLSGIPEHFCSIQYLRGRNIKLVFSPEVHQTTTTEIMRGAAILSLCSSLEARGNKVEIWLGWDNTVAGDRYESRILVKKPSELLNLASLAATFCDKDFLTTCEYNLISHFLKTKSVGGNSGITLKGDITLTGSYDDMHHFDTEEKCLAWIEKIKTQVASGVGTLQQGKSEYKG